MQVPRGEDAETDNQKLLALEGRDERRVVVVVDLDDLDAFGLLAGAAGPREGGDGVLACLHQRSREGATDAARGLFSS